MADTPGNLSLLKDSIALELLTSRLPIHLAYTWLDGTPRVVPMWFHWDGSGIFVCSPPKAPKLKAIRNNSLVAVTIDSDSWPYHVLSVRGSAEVTMLDDTAAEYAAAAERYFGAEQGRAWVDQLRGQPMARIRIEPEWVNILDFQTRLPSALSG